MIKKYKFKGEKEIICCETATEFVQKMNNGSFSQQTTTEEYMQNASERAFRLGLRVRTDTTENFLSDLIQIGLVEEITEVEENTNNTNTRDMDRLRWN